MGRRPASIVDVISQVRAGVRSIISGTPPDKGLVRQVRPGPDPADDPIVELAERLKQDIRARFAEGQSPAALEYFEKYPEFAADKDQALSLIYEEYCLLDDRNLRPETTAFCDRYAQWTNSLREQLQFHQIFSQAVDPRAQATPSRYPEPGETFCGFLIHSEIGQGGAARVYLAIDEALGSREVVLKVSSDRGNEASIQGRLTHPGIVPVLSVTHDSESSLRCLCMPFRPGPPLDQVISRLFAEGRKPKTAEAIWKALAPNSDDFPIAPQGSGWEGFPIRGSFEEGAAWIVLKIADALRYAHSKGIYHRDVKPANILLTWKEGPQLLDFNLAHAPHSPEQAAFALRGGTLPYMAPEQLRAFRKPECWDEVGGSSDLYSLAIVARELLTGEPPVVQDPQKSLAQTISELLDSRSSTLPRPNLRSANPRIPHGLGAILELALKGEPRLRYPDAGAFTADLQRFLDHGPLVIARNPSLPERAGNWVERHRRTIQIASAAAVAGALILGAIQLKRWSTPYQARPEFSALVGKLESKSFDEARAGFNDLKTRGYDFPLLWVHLAECYKESIVPDDVLDRLASIWANRSTESELREWSRTHPAFLRDLEKLGLALYRQKGVGEQRNSARRRTASDLIKFVLAREPDPKKEKQLLAVIGEENGDFAESDALSTDLIEKSRGPATPESQAELIILLKTRARTNLKWVEKSLRGTSDQFVDAKVMLLLKAAYRDMDQISKIAAGLGETGHYTPYQVKEDQFFVDYLRCEGKMHEGDLLEAQGVPLEARTAYRRSLEALAELSSVALETDYFSSLSARVRSRLEKSSGPGPGPGAAPPASGRKPSETDRRATANVSMKPLSL